jgi:CRP-like cAMP-binding protein
VLQIEYLGRLEGTVVRHFENGFAVSLLATRRKREKLASWLTWLAERDANELQGGRRQMTPRRVETKICHADGRCNPARIRDLSASGVALMVKAAFDIGSSVVVGGHTKGRVVRIFEGGVDIDFLRLIPLELLNENLEL